MKGIDVSIERIRLELETKFQTLDSSFIAYGRTFRNERKKKSIPEIFVGGKEYQETLFNDKIAGHCFFYHNSDINLQKDQFGKTDISIYFAVNLEKLYPLVDERATEYLHENIMQEIAKTPFKVSKIGTGFESWDKFKLSDSKDNLQPYYLCRVDLEIFFALIERIPCNQ